MNTQIPAFLPLTGDQDILLRSLNEGRKVTWATKSFLGRQRNMGLIHTDGEVRLTDLGARVVRLIEAHWMTLGARMDGGRSHGTGAWCSCGKWEFGTNQPGARGKRFAKNQYAAHLAEHLANA